MKAQYVTGRPHDSPRYCIQHIRNIAPPALMSAHHTDVVVCKEHQVINLPTNVQHIHESR